jgi:DNA repair exonuclease SbcCD nuclease subunit
MKIAICSDLHLEFGDLDFTNDEGADVLVLGGDIFIANELSELAYDQSAAILPATSTVRARGKRYLDFVTSCSERFPHVILIMGNHEHYHGDFALSARIIRDTFGHLSNVYFMDKEWRIINGVLFFGGTLWTDMNREDPITMHQVRYQMNDFNCVKNTLVTEDRDFKTFHPADAVEDHKRFLTNLDDALNSHPGLTTVVCGHHAPSRASTHPRYKTEFVIGGAYNSNLDDYILDRRQIKLWTHGHTHDDFDYMIGTTRIVCNPRGYDGYEARADNFKLKYVEI